MSLLCVTINYQLLSDEILGEELEEKSKCILTALDDSSDIVREMAVSILPDTFWLLRGNARGHHC